MVQTPKKIHDGDVCCLAKILEDTHRDRVASHRKELDGSNPKVQLQHHQASTLRIRWITSTRVQPKTASRINATNRNGQMYFEETQYQGKMSSRVSDEYKQHHDTRVVKISNIMTCEGGEG